MAAVMASQFCSETLEELSHLVNLHGTFKLIMTVLNLFFAALATMANILLATCAIWKSSSMSQNIRILLLNLALSDLTVGSLAQVMFGVITAVIGTFRSEYEYDYEYEFSVLSTRTLKNVDLQT